MGGDAVERRRKGQSLLLRGCCEANESGDTRLLAAGRANRDSGGRRQPADTDGLAEVNFLHTSDHASATATRRLYADSPTPGR